MGANARRLDEQLEDAPKGEKRDPFQEEARRGGGGEKREEREGAKRLGLDPESEVRQRFVKRAKRLVKGRTKKKKRKSDLCRSSYIGVCKKRCL